MEKRFLLASEVAELLCIDKQRVYELARTNRLPVIRVGMRQYRFSVTALERWIESGGNREKGGETNDQ